MVNQRKYTMLSCLCCSFLGLMLETEIFYFMTHLLYGTSFIEVSRGNLNTSTLIKTLSKIEDSLQTLRSLAPSNLFFSQLILNPEFCTLKTNLNWLVCDNALLKKYITQEVESNRSSNRKTSTIVVVC